MSGGAIADSVTSLIATRREETLDHDTAMAGRRPHIHRTAAGATRD